MPNLSWNEVKSDHWVAGADRYVLTAIGPSDPYLGWRWEIAQPSEEPSEDSNPRTVLAAGEGLDRVEAAIEAAEQALDRIQEVRAGLGPKISEICEQIILVLVCNDLHGLHGLPKAHAQYHDLTTAWRRLLPRHRKIVMELNPAIGARLRALRIGTIAEQCEGRLTPLPDADAAPMEQRVAVLADNIRMMRAMLGWVHSHFPQDPEDLVALRAWIEDSDRTTTGLKQAIRVLGKDLEGEQRERDAAEDTPLPRGRPPVAGGAMTGAERQRMYRARQREDLGIVEVTLKVPADQVDRFRQLAEHACEDKYGSSRT